MLTVTEHLRRRLLERAGLWPEPRRLPPPDVLREQELGPLAPFMAACDARLVMGKYRGYPSLREPAMPGQRQYVDRAWLEIDLYWQDGNLEHLVDAVNVLRVEAVRGRHPRRHWHAEDDAPRHLEYGARDEDDRHLLDALEERRRQE